jgi:hypothetical protein
VIRGLAAALATAATLALAIDAAPLAPFSRGAPGATLPPGWEARFLQRVPRSQVALVADEGTTVLEVRSQGSAGVAAHGVRAEAGAHPILAWRWKVDRVVVTGDLTRREGDDFAARVYVFFDLPLAEVPFVDRFKIRLARLLYGEEVPTAAICYVWDNRQPPGTTAWNAYTDRVRVVVLESGAARAGRWVEARRDVAADFRAAFGSDIAVPAVSGIALGNDTDQTGEAATARFGDVSLEARR